MADHYVIPAGFHPPNRPDDLPKAPAPTVSDDHPPHTPPAATDVQPELEPTPEFTSTSQPDEDRVGYKRPPKQHQFKKGQSGNPRGAKPKSTNIDSIFKQELDSKIAFKTADGTVRYITKREAIAKRVIDGALKGNVRQLEFLVRYLRSLGEPDPLRLTANDDAELARLLRQLGAGDEE